MEPKDTISDEQSEQSEQSERPERAELPEPPAAPAAPAASAAPAEPAVPAAPVMKRPRGRTALLVAVAAVLGIGVGTAAGYEIQDRRDPTPLPALSQPGLAYPAKALPPGKAPDPLPVSQDRRAKTDGDLRKLLINRPAGWSDDPLELGIVDGWASPDIYARSYKDEGGMYEYLLESDVRRVAAAAWKRGQYANATVQLVQFRPSSVQAAREFAEDQLAYMSGSEIGAGNEGDAIKGSGIGRYYLYGVERKPGYMPLYHARATMYRGDIMADIHLYDTVPISKKDIRTLAERQLERL
ncbi:hypothetical protein ACF08W_04345 [Streptomyces sp. NPDC015144]|uniref:hypothetical protein n=1 Tax=Streptomyces sp. NPDC015144 TaxID=3364944 RepID=UPI0036FB2223